MKCLAMEDRKKLKLLSQRLIFSSALEIKKCTKWICTSLKSHQTFMYVVVAKWLQMFDCIQQWIQTILYHLVLDINVRNLAVIVKKPIPVIVKKPSSYVYMCQC